MCYEGLTHVIVETEKSLTLLSACWRPGKAGGVLQCKSEGVRTRGAEGANLSPGQEKMRWGISCRAVMLEKGKFLLPLPLVLFKPSVN